MSVWQILVRSFRLYLRNFWRFLGMAIVIYLPLTAVRLVFTLCGRTETIQDLGRWQSSVFDISETLVLGILGTFVGFLFTIAIFRIISGRCLNSQITFREICKLIWSRSRTVLMASVFLVIIYSLLGRLMTAEMLWHLPNVILTIIILGFVVLISTLLGIFLVVTPQCIITTNLSAWQSMKQSKALAKGNIARVFGLIVCLELIHLGIYFTIIWLDKLLLVPLWQHMSMDSAIFISFRYTIVGILSFPLSATVHSFLYYDLRARKDGIISSLPPQKQYSKNIQNIQDAIHW